ncbi:DUF6899 family protein [Kaarinaea lacus]
MPYIDSVARDRIKSGGKPENSGELNYTISLLIDDYLKRHVAMKYTHLNEVVGVLECAKLELYRRLAVPYEEQKMRDNGDVYSVLPKT